MTPTPPSPTLFAVPRAAATKHAGESMPASARVKNKVLYTTGTIVAGLLRFAPGAHEVAHLHLEGEHHIWVLGGSIRIEDTELGADSYVHIPKRLTHTIEDCGVGSLLFYVFCPEND
jgi:uncharacterized RmlC-like cupin family protein